VESSTASGKYTSLNQTLLPDELPKFREHLVSDLDKNVKLFNWNVNANIIENLTNFELHLIGKGILPNQIFPVLRASVPSSMRIAVFNSEATLRNKPWSDICKLVRRILEPGKYETDYEVELYSLEFFDKSSVRSCVNKFKAYAKYTDLKQSVLIEKFLLKVKCTRYHDMLRYHNTFNKPYKTLERESETLPCFACFYQEFPFVCQMQVQLSVILGSNIEFVRHEIRS
jgi:hypothetical protein